MNNPDIAHAAYAIDRLGQNPFTIEQFSGGGFTDGIWDKGTPIEVAATGVYYDVSWDKYGDILQPLADGDRSERIMLLWTRTEVRGAINNQQNADRVIIGSERYKVVHVWKRVEGGFYRALILRDVARGNTA